MGAKVFFGLIVLVFTTTLSFAQTQQGYVKTKGRMVDGKLVPGQGIKGASVTVQGRTAVLVNADDGAFSFPIPDKTFHLQEVKKNGYQLVDADIIKRSFTYSTTPIYIVMETPDQQLSDQLAAERKIRRTMQRKLEEREDEIEALKAQQKITTEEYLAALQRLYAEMESNERLIADMAKEYAQMDYDQMDELNRRISDAIVNGRLAEADSLLHSKGDIDQRINEIRREQQAEALRQEQLDLEKAELESAKEGTQKKLDDIADDCERFFDRFKMSLQFDSAAYYIELRASLDTNNALWQYDAAVYCQNQNQYDKAETYYLRLHSILSLFDDKVPDELELDLMALSMSCLGALYSDTQRPIESEEMFSGALSIYRELAQTNPDYEPDVASMLNHLAVLYADNGLFKESESMHLEALEIRRRLAKAAPENYEYALSQSLENIGNLYNDTKRYAESEAAHLEALEIRRRLAKESPDDYDDLASTLNNLGSVTFATSRLTEAEAWFSEALEIRRRLAKENPQANEPELALALNNLAVLYNSTQRPSEAEAMYLEALEIRRRLAKNAPQAFEPELATSLNSLGGFYNDLGDLENSIAFYQEALEIRRRLADNNPLAYNPELANTLYNLALVYANEEYGEEFLEEREALLLEATEIRRHLTEDNPQIYKSSLISALLLLSSVYSEEDDINNCYQIDLELLPLLEAEVKSGDASQKKNYEKVLYTLTLGSFLTGHFSEAEDYARQLITVDPSDGIPLVVLAETLLLQGKYEDAEPYFLKMKDAYREGFLNDFEDLEANGLVPKERKPDIERIIRLLED